MYFIYICVLCLQKIKISCVKEIQRNLVDADSSKLTVDCEPPEKFQQTQLHF